MVTVLEMTLQIKTDSASTYVIIKVQPYFRHYSLKLIADTAYVPTGQAIMKRYNKTSKEMVTEQKGVEVDVRSPGGRLNSDWLPFKFVGCY